MPFTSHPLQLQKVHRDCGLPDPELRLSWNMLMLLGVMSSLSFKLELVTFFRKMSIKTSPQFVLPALPLGPLIPRFPIHGTYQIMLWLSICPSASLIGLRASGDRASGFSLLIHLKPRTVWDSKLELSNYLLTDWTNSVWDFWDEPGAGNIWVFITSGPKWSQEESPGRWHASGSCRDRT